VALATVLSSMTKGDDWDKGGKSSDDGVGVDGDNVVVVVVDCGVLVVLSIVVVVAVVVVCSAVVCSIVDVDGSVDVVVVVVKPSFVVFFSKKTIYGL